MEYNSLFPISSSVDIVDLTPNPENPRRPELPEFPGGFEEIPEFPPLRNPPFGITLCKLKLKQGCYKISMDSTTSFPTFRGTNFRGTMRVENHKDANGNLSQEISGDFYRKLNFGIPFPNFQFPEELSQDTFQKIPIFSRKRYHSYLKVVGIKKPKFVLQGRKCTITLTVEEYRYTPPATDSGHGNFPPAPTRTLRIVLQSVAPPAGHTGPSFEGKVFEGTTLLPVIFKMEWVSKFFRRATLELENVTGAAIPASAGAHNFKTIYASAGWDLTVNNGDTNLPVPAGVSANNPWSNAELHAFLLANRNPAINLDSVWHYYYVAVPHSSDFGSIFGIMFDQIGDHREGSCNFINNMTGNFGDAFSKLRSAAHEIGHGFNQLHPQNEADPNMPLDNFIMTQSGDTRNAILAGGGTYPNDIRFEFSEHHKHHLVHAPDIVVRPGGEDFGFGHSEVLPGSFNPEDAELATDLGLSLEIDTVRNHIKLGEPLQVEFTLKNNGKHSLKIPETISWSGMNTGITVGHVNGDMRPVSSFSHICDSTGHKILDAGKSVKAVERVFWDTSGFVFTQPGVHKVDVTMRWNMDGVGIALQAEKYIWVDYPVTAKENEAAALLMHPEVGKYVALGGKANHLDTAVERIKKVAEVDKDHPGYDCIRQLDAEKKSSK